ncbi:hypothetical protein EF910_03085 [Streptomyces sp. WAC07149]|uniref:hypothetical protein n=1 Tax=Streptomyces sp. WAC07149 TaxID=2487425 RepID=UPI000F79D55E|nr:hypothetical protein [Streptomyces sp. WAC07149]RST08289.1 hypothetical protein EF910_03085 [Streptomyces sp. WAC07149]
MENSTPRPAPDIEPETAAEPDIEPGTTAEPSWSAPVWLRVPAAALVMAAVMTGAGYAVYRWAATGLPMEPLPGSPWPYLGAWAVLTFLAGLLLQWATSGIDYDGRWALIGVPFFAGIRLSLAYRPDPALIYAYGLAALAAGAAGIALWRRQRAAAAAAGRR